MTKNEIMIVVGLAGIASAAVGYAFGQKKKLDDISAKIGRKIDDISLDVDVEIKDDIVKSAVHKAVEREVGEAVTKAANAEAKSLVSEYRDGIKKRILDTVEKSIDETDISKIKQAVIDKASEKAARKMTEGLEYIFDDFRRNLRRMANRTTI